MGGFRAGAGQDTVLVLTTRSASPPSIARVPIEGPQGRKNAHVKSAHLKVSIKRKKNTRLYILYDSNLVKKKNIYIGIMLPATR